MDLFLNSARNFTKKLFDEELLDDLLMDDKERQVAELVKQLEQTKIQLRKAQMELSDLRMSERSRIALVKDLAEEKEEYMEICNKQAEQCEFKSCELKKDNISVECIKETADEDDVKPDCAVSAELKRRCDMLEMEKQLLLEENGQLMEDNAQLQDELKLLHWDDEVLPEWASQLPTYQAFAQQMNKENQLSGWDGFSEGYGPDEMNIRLGQSVEDKKLGGELEEAAAKLLSLLKMANKQMEHHEEHHLLTSFIE